MWHWDQGRLAYFQFDALRQIARFVDTNDFKRATKSALRTATGLEFAAPETHSAWRNYSRVLKLCLLVSEVAGRAQATPVAHLLAQPGLVTCDEYLHFLAQAFTEPSPALQDWRPDASFRYPLLFALKYLLTKAAITDAPVASFGEIVGAYWDSGFDGDEGQEPFIAIAAVAHENAGRSAPVALRRQARESLQVIAQISYLHVRDSLIVVSLNREDARNMFNDLVPVIGPRERDSEAEIRRLAGLFSEGRSEISFDYPNTVINEVVESGFREGSKVKRTHLIIERNASLRRDFFERRPTAICDVCELDTARTYPWTDRVMDLHHLLPLSSGTRVEAEGTTLDDLVPVCPSCHRAVHRFYDGWLIRNGREDFTNGNEAHEAYRAVKTEFPGLIQNA